MGTAQVTTCQSASGRLTISLSTESPAVEPAGGLVSLGFITAALKRRRRLWCITAAVGLLLGCGFYLKSPPGYQASTSLLLTPGPYENIKTAANNDQAMAQTRTVAALAVRQLGLKESASSFLSNVQGHAHHRTGDDHHGQRAVERPGGTQRERRGHGVPAVPGAGDGKRAETGARVARTSRSTQAQQHLSSINAQISQLPAQPASSAQQSQLKNLQAQRAQAQNSLSQLQQAALSTQTANGSATVAAVKGSVVLDRGRPARALAAEAADLRRCRRAHRRACPGHRPSS